VKCPFKSLCLLTLGCVNIDGEKQIRPRSALFIFSSCKTVLGTVRSLRRNQGRGRRHGSLQSLSGRFPRSCVILRRCRTSRLKALFAGFLLNFYGAILSVPDPNEARTVVLVLAGCLEDGAELCLALSRDQFGGFLVAAHGESAEDGEGAEETHHPKAPAHVDAVLVHDGEDEGQEPPEDLAREEVAPHDFGFLALGRQGDEQNSLGRVRPPHEEPPQRRHAEGGDSLRRSVQVRRRNGDAYAQHEQADPVRR
jgi:hypothetical protein